MSNEIGSIAKALAEAQAQMGGVLKASHRVEVKGKDGKPGYEYKYANLAEALAIVSETLNVHGISVLQPTGHAERGVIVTTLLVHGSGQWFKSDPLLMPVSMNNAQAVGSAITYGRRYQLLGMVGLATEDDDGRGAGDHPPERRPRKPKPVESDEPDIGPRCRGKAGAIAKAITERLATLAPRMGVHPDGLYKTVLKKRGIDTAKYGGGTPKPADLTIEDGTLLAAALLAKIEELDGVEAECQKAWSMLCERAPDDFSTVAWPSEWATFAGLPEWLAQPLPQHYADALAGMQRALERIEAP